MVSTEILKVEKRKCTGCGLCKNICHELAISMVIDQEGFWYPAIDANKCLFCGRCAKVCPVLRESSSACQNKKRVEIYAAWSQDEKIRFYSTSGGIFSELALSVLKDGGYICGAIYDENYTVKHFIINDKSKLEMLRQSKYVQSDMGHIYEEIGELLKQRETLLFCGTPCQCQAVLNYCEELKIDIERLYLIDFICRGSNSPKVYTKFLEELGVKYQSKISKVWFKNKTYGWNRFSTKIEFENGKYYLKDRYQDVFIRGYIEENLYIRQSCMDCNFKGFQRNVDITLGDFWGVNLEEYDQESDGGTSMVMIHTEKGKKLWSSISERIYYTKKTLKEVTRGNVCFMNSVKAGEHREEFMRDLDNMPVIKNIERFLKNI